MKIAINTKTQEEYNKLMEIFENKGWKWRDGLTPSKEKINFYPLGRSNSVLLYQDNFSIGNKENFEANGIKVISFRELLEKEGMGKDKLIEFQGESNKEQLFYYVFVPGNGEPKIKHIKLRDAKIEAQRIAQLTGKEAFILQAVKSYRVNDLTEVNYSNL